jgi:hypothetical protein
MRNQTMLVVSVAILVTQVYGGVEGVTGPDSDRHAHPYHESRETVDCAGTPPKLGPHGLPFSPSLPNKCQVSLG